MKKVELLKRIYSLFHINEKSKNDNQSEIKKDLEKENVIITSISKEKFKDICKYDIVLANRIPKSPKVVKKGHHIGPFLVLNKQENELTCIYGSSNCMRKKSEERFIVDSKNYDLDKDTCFYITELFNYDERVEYLKKLGTLNDYDKHLFLKKLSILKDKHPSLKKYSINLPLEVGDIFKYNNNFYLAFEICDNMLTAIKVSNDINCYKFISNSGENYIYYSDIITIENRNYKVLDFVTKEVYENIKKQFEDYKWQKCNISRGTIIKCQDKILYVYSEEGMNYSGYEIFAPSLKDEFKIVVNRKSYSADFENIFKINKKDNFDIIATATIEEADKNRMVKKSYNKQKPKQVKISKPMKKIKEGSVVCDKTLMHTEYVVIKRNNYELLTAMFDNNKIYFSYMDLKDVNLNRQLEKEEFIKVLTYIKNQSNYCKYIDEENLNIIFDKIYCSKRI